MRIVLTGGGTGGHLTPLVAVADKLKAKLGSEANILYIGSGAEM
jgi:UDP-N-acetylglucosamine:LPS N-acetylglucosamine transferase